MQAYILLGILLGLPLLLGFTFRVSVASLFLALLCGDLLQRYFRDDTTLALRTAVRNPTVQQYVGLAILVLPILLTTLFLHHTLTKGKTLLNVIPLAICGIVFAAFAAPLLPGGLQSQLGTTEAGRLLQQSTDLIIGAMVGLQLIFLWIFGRANEKHGKKH